MMDPAADGLDKDETKKGDTDDGVIVIDLLFRPIMAPVSRMS